MDIRSYTSKYTQKTEADTCGHWTVLRFKQLWTEFWGQYRRLLEVVYFIGYTISLHDSSSIHKAFKGTHSCPAVQTGPTGLLLLMFSLSVPINPQQLHVPFYNLFSVSISLFLDDNPAECNKAQLLLSLIKWLVSVWKTWSVTK